MGDSSSPAKVNHNWRWQAITQVQKWNQPKILTGIRRFIFYFQVCLVNSQLGDRPAVYKEGASRTQFTRCDCTDATNLQLELIDPDKQPTLEPNLARWIQKWRPTNYEGLEYSADGDWEKFLAYYSNSSNLLWNWTINDRRWRLNALSWWKNLRIELNAMTLNRY